MTLKDLRISYIRLLDDTETRQKNLREQYYFQCKCEECVEDPGQVDKLKKGAAKCPACSKAVDVNPDMSSEGKENI